MPHPAAAPADLVLTGGRVLTMDPARPSAEALAVRAGRIVAVGRSVDVARFVGPRTRVVQAGGRTILPGLQDAHAHPVMAGIGFLRCYIGEVDEKPEAYVQAIAAYAAAHPELPWIVGDGWYMGAFPSGLPRREDLDRAVPDRPAFLDNHDGHGAWVNSRALEMAGIDRATPDPSDGRIERDPDGTPSGTLHEGAADLVERLIPPASVDEIVDGLGIAQSILHGWGVTGWQDASARPADLAAYRVFAERGLLTGRAVVCQLWDLARGTDQVEEMVEARRISAIGRLRAGSVKMFQDGVIENFTAAMLHPYLDGDGRATTNRGHSLTDPEALGSHVTRLDAEAFQVHVHAIGDRAVREALDAFEAARAANGPTDGRHHIAHLQVVDPADWPRFARLGVTANIQPLWGARDQQVTDFTLPFITPDRGALMYPFGSLRRAGARLAGGSDWTVSTAHVLMEVEVAITRRARILEDQRPLGADEALSPADALAAFTIGSAYVNHLDDVTGSLEVGKLADIVVLDRDIEAAPELMGDGKVLLTFIEGVAVHDTGEL